MSDFGFVFDVSKVPEEDTSFEPIPKGWYGVIIEGAQVKATNAGDGKYMSLKLRVTGPTHPNRVIFDNVALMTETDEPGKQKWAQIGQQKLAQLCRSVGLESATNSQVFVGKQALCKVKVSPANGDRDAGNEVQSYKHVTDGESQQASAAPAAAPWAQ